MKKQLIMVGIFLVAATSFGQKKELKKAQRAYKGNDIGEAMQYINEAEGMISGADADMKADFYLLKGQVYLADAGKNDFEKMKGAAAGTNKQRAHIKLQIDEPIADFDELPGEMKGRPCAPK